MIEVCKLEHQLYPREPGETLNKSPDFSSDSEGNFNISLYQEKFNYYLKYVLYNVQLYQNNDNTIIILK